ANLTLFQKSMHRVFGLTLFLPWLDFSGEPLVCRQLVSLKILQRDLVVQPTPGKRVDVKIF
ncbi:MAG TPA: hypothetical protein PLN34_09995, partial [Alloprevotella sp.]|nr:hypothetical protein [Alloprevotella sp.]